MGATKDNEYSIQEVDLTLIARSISHPARIRILSLLFQNENGFCNQQFMELLNLSRPTVRNHIEMMKDAGILEIEYFVHFYNVRLSKRGERLAELVHYELANLKWN